MRLLFVSTDTRPMVGGIARGLDSWLCGLKALGHEVCVLSILPERVFAKNINLPRRDYREEWLILPERIWKNRDRWVLIRKFRTAIFLTRQRQLIERRFCEIVEQFCPDCVVISVINPLCCIPLSAVKRRGLFNIAIAWGSEINPPHVPNPRWLRRTLVGFDRVLAISRYTMNLLAGWGVERRRVVVIHPGLAPDFFVRENSFSPLTATDSEDKLTESGHLHLLTICRLAERKGVQTVIKAVAVLRDKFPGLRYTIVGEGIYGSELQRLVAKLNLERHVKFYGGLSDQERDALIQSCDIFVMVPFEPADGDVEGFGIVYLEAGVFGKPVIGSNSGGVSDAVKHLKTGLLVAPDNVEETISAIRTLALDHSLRIQFGKEGYLWAQQHSPMASATDFIQGINVKSIRRIR